MTRPPRPGEVLRSLAFYAAFYVGTLAFLALALAVLPFDAGMFRRVAGGWACYHRACLRRLLGIVVVLEGTPPPAGTLIALKHESFFEALDQPVLFGAPAVFAKAELLRIPLWGRAAAAYGVIPVERDQGAKALRAMLAAARTHTAAGRQLVIFPEGTRVPHGETPPLQAGFAGLYKLLGLPVVPVAVDSGLCYRPVWKRRGTIRYRFGETIPPGLPRSEVEARVGAAINALNADCDRPSCDRARCDRPGGDQAG